MSGPTLSIRIGNRSVRGVITHRTTRDIAVQIVAPFINLLDSLHVPYFVGGRIDLTGPTGDATARSLLLSTYRLGQFLEANLPGLQGAWKQHLLIEAEPLNGLLADREAIQALRRTGRADLKAGRISQTQFQSELARLRKEVRRAEAALWQGRWGFFTHNFPEKFLSVDLEPQVVPILEGRLPLLATSTTPTDGRTT